MAEVKWIKLCIDMFSNRKIKQIEHLPEGKLILLIWIKLLCLAGIINDNGLLYVTKNKPFTDQSLATELGEQLPTVQLAIRVFLEFEMLEEINGCLCISNWEKYQNAEELKKIRKQNAERQKRFREKHNQLSAPEEDVTLQITLCNAAEQEQDKNKNKNKNKNNCLLNKQIEIRELITDTEYDALAAEVVDIEVLLNYVQGYIKEPPTHPYQYLLAVAKRQHYLKADRENFLKEDL